MPGNEKGQRDDKPSSKQQPARRQIGSTAIGGQNHLAHRDCRGAHFLPPCTASSCMVWRRIHRRTAASVVVPAKIAIAAPSGPSAGTRQTVATITTPNEQRSATKFTFGRSIAHRPLPATTPALLASTLSDRTPIINPAPANAGP